MPEPDPTALDDLLNRGYRYARVLARENAAAEDLLQDALVSVLRAEGPLSPPYLFTVIRNRYIDIHRRGRRASIHSLDDEMERDLAADSGDRAEVCDDFEVDTERLGEALGTLRDEEREVVYLTYVEDLTAREIAELTQSPRGTVLSRLHRARARLKAWYEALFAGAPEERSMP